jgi:hypothetical protein
MIKFQLLAMVITTAVVSSAMADTAVKPAMNTSVGKPSKQIKPATMTCEDFLDFDDVSRPAIVYWSEGVNSKGKPEDGVFDIERTNRLVPVLVEECRKEPQTPFWTKVKMELKKVF